MKKLFELSSCKLLYGFPGGAHHVHGGLASDRYENRRGGARLPLTRLARISSDFIVSSSLSPHLPSSQPTLPTRAHRTQNKAPITAFSDAMDAMQFCKTTSHLAYQS